MTATRRLAGILAADVAGYSRLMGADEEGTHERLKAHLRELVEPKIAGHRGRTVKNTGDGLLAEFPSVVDAVRCAVEVQRGMAERNEGTPSTTRIDFRIGINLGEGDRGGTRHLRRRRECRAFLIGAHQARVSRRIGCKDPGKTAGRCHSSGNPALRRPSA